MLDRTLPAEYFVCLNEARKHIHSKLKRKNKNKNNSNKKISNRRKVALALRGRDDDDDSAGAGGSAFQGMSPVHWSEITQDLMKTQKVEGLQALKDLAEVTPSHSRSTSAAHDHKDHLHVSDSVTRAQEQAQGRARDAFNPYMHTHSSDAKQVNYTMLDPLTGKPMEIPEIDKLKFVDVPPKPTALVRCCVRRRCYRPAASKGQVYCTQHLGER